jgi:hypothetical protein
MRDEKIKVLYIAGFGRIGSTLVARLLGELDGFLNVGEGARALFNQLLRSDVVPCGCGKQVPDCPFWKDIVSQVDDDDQDFFKNKVRARYLPLLLSSLKPSDFRKQQEKFLATLENLFKLIAKNENCRVIVDSSKLPLQAYMLSQIPSIELYVVHLIKDPRGVVSSWSKPKKYLRPLPMRKITLGWSVHNLLSEPLRLYAQKYLPIRYEDFVNNPGETVKKIASAVGEGVKNLDFLQGKQAWVSVQHMLASNPDKYATGEILIKEQDWQLPWYKNLFVSLMTLPLLLRYQYPIFKASS